MNDSDCKRLAMILGMLGSEHDGEILAAARQAHKFVTSRDLTWFDIFDKSQGSKGFTQNAHGSNQSNSAYESDLTADSVAAMTLDIMWSETWEDCTDWECDFVTDLHDLAMNNDRWRPSFKQEQVLRRLYRQHGRRKTA